MTGNDQWQIQYTKLVQKPEAIQKIIDPYRVHASYDVVG